MAIFNVQSRVPLWESTDAQVWIQGIVDALGGACSLHLATSFGGPLTPASDAATFFEATFDGYAPIVAFPAGHVDALLSESGASWLQVQLFTWICNGPVPGNLIIGYWVDDGAGGWILAEQFDAPIPIGAKGDCVNFELALPFQLVQSAI